ncbi:MAG: hypothetical protein M0P33_04665 [Massilibacteroides sp.]|nr:hypothetical protein [Massilibacteroides sp.]
MEDTNSLYHNTLHFLDRIEFTYKGVELKKLLFQSAFNFGNLDYRLFRLFKVLFKRYDSSRLVNLLSNNRTVFLYSFKRNDYFEWFTKISTACNVDKHYLVYSLIHSKLGLPNFKLVKIALKETKSLQLKSKESIFIFLRLYDFLMMIDTIDDTIMKANASKSLKVENLVTMNAQTDFENIITQILNKLGKKTFFLSHGLHFCNYKEFYPVDALIKYCIPSNHVMVWGKSSVNTYSKPYNTIVAGNILYPMKQINISNTFTNGVVLTARYLYDEENFKLLHILGQIKKEKNINFTVKPHPNSNTAKIKGLCQKYDFIFIDSNQTVSNLLRNEKYDFAISYQTTAYFEAMYYNMICFRYSYKENEDYGNLNDRFSSYQELNDQIEKYKKQSLPSTNQEIKQCLIDNLGMGINRYTEYIH